VAQALATIWRASHMARDGEPPVALAQAKPGA